MTLSFLWDYNLTEAQYKEILSGKLTIGRLDQDWAAIRLLEYGSYDEIKKELGISQLIKGWPKWRSGIKSTRRVRSFDWLVTWVPEHHPEWK
jgi:hypothetical protein